ncbi:MAG: glucose-6-phosphate dehydrogenase, partial [Pseudomonadota bacterium]
MVSRVIPVDPFDLVIFGGTGDLAQRKILPALFRRFCAGQWPEDARIIAAARRSGSADDFRNLVADALSRNAPRRAQNSKAVTEFLQRVDYVTVDGMGETGWAALAQKLSPGRVRAFYFSVGPSLFGPLAERIRAYDMATEHTRIVVEKPFGHDLHSARELNATLAAHFDESQIYRIDHYLGKETVQNLMAVRFGNMLFEPLWNSQYVDHIQITVAETVGIDGREDYYERAGAMR